MQGALTGACLALIDQAPWAAVATVVTATVTAWAEFTGSETKMARFSNTITEIGNINTWWNSLDPVDKASVAQINRLVEACETTFQHERQSWVATSTASKMLTKALKDNQDTAP